MRRFALALVVVSCCVLAVSAALIRTNHVGALNQRLTREQLAVQDLDDVEAQWLTQKLDHQDLAGTATFQQKYYVVDDWYVASTPRVFLTIGGEAGISPDYVGSHFITTAQAQEHSAMLVALEHRFYGQSVPNNDSSTANLKYLSSAQALEDLVVFREAITAQYSLPDNTIWIVIGGSYSGSLAAWARSKYPNLFHGSLAASSPVQAELDFSQYFEVVQTSVGPTCAATIQKAFWEVDQLLQRPTGLIDLAQKFDLCASPATPNDVATFVAALSDPISGVVQYNDDNNKYQPFNLTTMCSILTSASSAIDGLAQVWQQNNAYTNVTGCTDITYKGLVQGLQATSDGRSWTWQTCTEFGYFQTAEGTAQPFPLTISLEWFVQQCADVFGVTGLTPRVSWINDFYGGWDIVTSNTCFTGGDVDPWHKLQNVQKYASNSGSDNILIHGTAHCASMYPARSQDLPGLVAARQRQEQLLAVWLGESKSTTVLNEQ